jgi:hypothetical protein
MKHKLLHIDIFLMNDAINYYNSRKTQAPTIFLYMCKKCNSITPYIQVNQNIDYSTFLRIFYFQ